MQKRCVANKRPKGQVVEHHLESVHVPANSSAQPKALHMNQLRNFYLFKKLKSKQLSLCWVNLKGCHDEYLFIFHSNPEFWKRSTHLSCYPANQRNLGYLCNDAGLGFTLHQTVYACETCVVNLIITAKDDKKMIHRDLNALFEPLQRSLKVWVLKIWCQTWVTLLPGLALTRSHQFSLGAWA